MKIKSVVSDMFSNLIVIELASVLAGPAVGMFFAELGATVIKIENALVGGDVTRSWKLAGESAQTDVPSYFACVNWGKKSIALDLTSDEGREIVYRLVRKADIVLTSYKPGDADKLGMDYATLSSLKPGLLYASVSGFGAESHRVGFDAVVQAESGFMYINGSPASGPLKMPVALIDLLAAHQLKEGLLLALIRRMQTGEGAHVHTSLMHAALASLANQAAGWLVAGVDPQPIGSEHPHIVPYGSVFRTKDDKPMLLAIGNDAQFARLMDCLERPDVAADSRFLTNRDRVRHREQLRVILDECIGARNRDELLDELERRKAPAGAIHSVSEALERPESASMILAAVRSSGETMRGVRSIAFTERSDSVDAELSVPPALSSDAWEILQTYAEYNREDIANMIAAQVVHDSNSSVE